ncbi:hypothetical protein GV792_03840 [Nocardia cyriacigeorgica]|uniref:Uncharacterized protein n=1 Tax=Nocardia cyriacigeorgica TaxID=135487 RepID=A0A6P1D2V1_9NOCA|nr:hypothetical protein [Nocardia cyriacigeorgica]NEW44915.1 hypothetical protein [Nocardia cyriacigeorgica]NEW49174.1 hypothetical protein [Nocardia cyriacigeorgica]
MRRLLVLAVLAMVIGIGIAAMASSMKFETDSGPAGSRTIIHFDATARSDIREPALRLWRDCASNVNHVRIVWGPSQVGEYWTVVLEPALGTHTERRLIGCLDDLTTDGILGRPLKAEDVGP